LCLKSTSYLFALEKEKLEFPFNFFACMQASQLQNMAGQPSAAAVPKNLIFMVSPH